MPVETRRTRIKMQIIKITEGKGWQAVQTSVTGQQTNELRNSQSKREQVRQFWETYRQATQTMKVEGKLVLLDEVGAGVNRTLLKDIGTSIERLNKEKGYTFCMIEHDMDFISRLCDPVIVMAEGSVLFEGTSGEVKKNEKVIESYLGRGSKIKEENGL